MSTDYKPGTVAIATVRGVPSVRVWRYGGSIGWISAGNVKGQRLHYDSLVTDIRPLVVLDIEDPESHVTALREFAPADSWQCLTWLANQIEAQTKPARIPEPGRWGVVRDEHGIDWVRTGPTPVTSIEWQNSLTGDRLDFNDIPGDPVLIREGVES